MKKTLVAIGATLCISGFLLADAIPSTAYIRRGLLAQWDAIDNAGVGTHDANATTWQDLGIKNYDFTLPDSGITVGATAITFDRVTAATAIAEFGSWGSWYIEAAARSDAAFSANPGVPYCSIFRSSQNTVFFRRVSDGLVGAGYNNASKRRYFQMIQDGKPSGFGATLHTYGNYNTSSSASLSIDGIHESVNTAFSNTTGDADKLPAFTLGNGTCAFDISGVRIYTRNLHSLEKLVNAALDRARFSGEPLVLPDGYTFAGKLYWRNAVVTSTGDVSEGTVSASFADSGASAAAGSAYGGWHEENVEITSESTVATATPASGYEFVKWRVYMTDGTVISPVEMTANPITVSSVQAVRLIAVFRKLSPVAKTTAWTGGSALDYTDWDDSDNWSNGVPNEGDTVTIQPTQAVTIKLTHATPRFASLTVGANASIQMANWTTKIEANTVTLNSGATITLPAAFSTSEMSNRVWIVANDVTIASDATINVNNKGYAKSKGPGYRYGGTAHGGHGPCYFENPNFTNLLMRVDNPADPRQPGSGGNNGDCVGGGGAVLIEATGTVTMDGTINANSTAKVGFNNSTGAGAGGSINIRCRRFKSNGGKLNAYGGDSTTGWNLAESANSRSLPGAGGMIAIVYDPAFEQDDDIENMTFDVHGGRTLCCWSAANTQSYYLGPEGLDLYHMEAGLGTLWFSDNRPFNGSLGTKMTGDLVYTNRFDLESLNMSAGYVRFSAEGVQVNVAGDLCITGLMTRVDLGGGIVTNRSSRIDYYSGKIAPRLTVGGDFKLQGGARFDVIAAETNGTDAAGAYVTVGGALTMDWERGKSTLTGNTYYFKVDGSNFTKHRPTSMYLSSDSFNGGSPLIAVGSFNVGSNCLVSAYDRGFACGAGNWVAQGKQYPLQGIGPGKGISNNNTRPSGGGHGGHGGYTVEGGGKVNDDEFRPSLPGSGGSGKFAGTGGGFGGGVVHVRASGKITIDGTINADGHAAAYAKGGSAGGTIMLEGYSIGGAEYAKLSADGGVGNKADNSFRSGGGGGGCIAIWCGSPWIEGVSKLKRCKKSETAFAATKDGRMFHGSLSVAGGICPTESQCDGADGTIWFVENYFSLGTMVIVK